MLRAALDQKVYDETLFDALLDARARYGDKEILEDQDRHPLTYTGLIRAAFVLGRKIAKLTQPGERVGVLLPSSAGVVVTFFALHAFGRVPVMLNFTSGEANLTAALKTAGVKKILSAKRFVTQAKLDDLMEVLGQVSEIVWLDDIRKTIGLADKLFGLSAGMAPTRFRVKTDPDSAGVVLFTTGSFGAPRSRRTSLIRFARFCSYSGTACFGSQPSFQPWYQIRPASSVRRPFSAGKSSPTCAIASCTSLIMRR